MQKQTLWRESFEAGFFFLGLLYLRAICVFIVWNSEARLWSAQLTLSVVNDSFVTSWTVALQVSLSPILRAYSYSCPVNQWCYLTISFSVVSFLLPPLVDSSIRDFSSKSVLCIRWPKYWNFSVSLSSSNEYSGLISFRTDWLDLLAVEGTLKRLLQDHSPTASVLRPSAFFTVQLSHPYMSTGKTIALTGQNFLAK